MVRHTIGFFRTLWQGPAWLVAWVHVLMVVHGVVPWFFLGRAGGAAMAVAFVLSSVTMMAMFGRYGMSRVLGAAHAWWLPAMFVLLAEGAAVDADTAYGAWIRVALLTGTLSLVVDLSDVIRWWRGDDTVAPPEGSGG